MPRYTFRTAAGHRLEVVLTLAEYSKRVRDGVIKLRKSEAGEHWRGTNIRAERDYAGDAGTLGVPSTTGWPLLSEAAGVNPSQVKQATEQARRLGVPTEFTRQGQAVMRDPTHRRKLLKALGMHDRKSFC